MKRKIWIIITLNLAICLALCAVCCTAAAEGQIRVNNPEEINADFQFQISGEDAGREYVNGLFGLPVTPKEDLMVPMRGTAGGESIPADSPARTLYVLLKERVKQIADGKATSTEFTFTEEEFSLVITAEDLGLTKIWEIGDDNVARLSDTADPMVEEMVSSYISQAIKAVQYDCPYEMFWHDSGSGCLRWGWGYGLDFTDDYQLLEQVRVINPVIRIRVSEDYSATENTPSYAVNSNLIRGIHDAADRAQAIVNENVGKSNVQMMTAYKDKISELTDYNYDAANKEYIHDYGNPWQLVWVFDNDPNTKVVCEGYSKAFQYLCDKSRLGGAKVISVSGTMDGGAHMWNIVRMNGKSYMADVTNSDNVRSDQYYSSGAYDGLFLDGYTSKGTDGRTYTYTAYAYKEHSGETITYVFNQEMTDLYGADDWLDMAAEDAEDVWVPANEPSATDGFTISCPDADQEGRVSLLLNESVDFEINIGHPVEGFPPPDVYLVIGTETREAPWPDEDGYLDTQWTAHETGQFYAYAKMEDGPENWIYSNVLRISVSYKPEAEVPGEVTYTVTGEYQHPDGNENIRIVPHNGVLSIEVNNTDAEFYGAYVTTGDGKKWLSDTHWVEKEWAPGKTLLHLPVVQLETNTDYSVHVYAVQYGYEIQEAAETIPIQVSAAEPQSDILIGMNDSYVVSAPVCFYAKYVGNGQLPESAEMRIRIYRQGNEDEGYFDERRGVDDFWETGVRIGKSGTFVLEASIRYFNNEEGHKQNEIWNNTVVTRTFKMVTNPAGQKLPDPAFIGTIPETISADAIGQFSFQFQVSYPQHISVIIVPDVEDIEPAYYAEASFWYEHDEDAEQRVQHFNGAWGPGARGLSFTEGTAGGNGTVTCTPGFTTLEPGQYQIIVMADRWNYETSDKVAHFTVSDPDLKLDVVNGEPNEITPDEGTAYSQYSGSYYYKIYIRNIPRSAESVQMGFGSADAAEPNDMWWQPVDRMARDSGGLFTMCLPEVQEGSTATTYSEAIFVRLSTEQAWQKAAFVYDLTKVNGAAAAITNQNAPELNGDYEITWSADVQADAYIVNWKMPNGEKAGFFLSGEDTQIRLSERGGEDYTGEFIRYPGEYEVWIETYANNSRGESAHRTLTVSVPDQQTGENNPQITLHSEQANNVGQIGVPIYGEVKVYVTADDALLDKDIRRFLLVNGLSEEGVNPWEIRERGRWEFNWRPDRENVLNQTVYACALVAGEEGEQDYWVYSNALEITVTKGEAIADNVTFLVDGETAQQHTQEPIEVPLDDALVLHVDNIGADYYGAEINERGNHLDHIAESRWVVAEGDTEGTTEVRLPVFECEAGREYEVRVYALSVGKPVKYAARTVRIRVTRRTGETPVILQIAKEPDGDGVYQYETDERIRVYAFYNNPNNEFDEEFSWIQIKAYPKPEAGQEPDYYFRDEEGDGFYYWTDNIRIGNPGEYIIEAVVMTNGGDWSREAWPIEETRTLRELCVSALNDETLDVPDVSLNLAKVTAGKTVKLTFGETVHADRYFWWVHRTDEPDDLMNGEMNVPGTAAINTDLLGPGVYTVAASVHGRGYIENFTNLYFAAVDPDDTEMSAPDNRYYFTCSATATAPDGAQEGGTTDFICDAGEDVRFLYFVPGAEEVNLRRKKVEWDHTDGFMGRDDAPGLYQGTRFDQRGVFEIYGCYRMPDADWSREELLCTIQVNAEGSLERPQVDMPMVVAAGESVTISFHYDERVENYGWWMSYENDDRRLAGDDIDREWLDMDEVEENEGRIDFTIQTDRLEPNRLYHIYLDISARGFEQGHDDRLLFVTGEADDTVTVTVKEQDGDEAEEIAIGNRYPVTVSAPGAEWMLVWWDEAASYIDIGGDSFEKEFCLDWKGGEGAPDYCTFYAIAVYDGSFLKVSETTEIPLNREAAEATAPTLTIGNEGSVTEEGGERQFNGTIYRGEFIQAIIGEIQDAGVYEYDAYVTNEDGEWICHSSSDSPGTILLPTNELRSGETYYLSAYARVIGKYRKDSRRIAFTITETGEASFIATKTTVAVMEPLAVSITAPGAERVRFYNGYEWEEDIEGDCWYDEQVRWDMSEDEVTIGAEAWYPGADEWTPVGSGIDVTITADGRLNDPQFLNDFPEQWTAGQDLHFTVSGVEGAEWYQLDIRRDNGDTWSLRTRGADMMIPGRWLWEGEYEIRLYALAYDRNAGQTETRLYVEQIRPEILVDPVVSNTKALDIRVPLIQGGDNYRLTIHYVPEDPDSYVYTADKRSEDATEGVLTFTVPKDKLRNNMTHWIDCIVDGRDFHAENAKAILVRNGEADSNVTVRVNGEYGPEVNVLIHDDFTVDVNAPATARAILIQYGDEWRTFIGNTVEDAVFNEHQEYPMTLYARAYYGNAELTEDTDWLSLDWGAASEPVVINFCATGRVGEPGARIPDSVTQGDILVISDIYAGDGGNETHANINRNDRDEEEDRVFGDDWRGWDEGSRTIYLPTATLEANRYYWVMLDNSGVGLRGNRMWHRFYVNARDEQPESGIVLSTLEKVQAGSNLPVSIYAPGATRVGFGLDLAENEKQDINLFETEGGDRLDRMMDGLHIDETGSHVLTAGAMLDVNGTAAWVTVDRVVQVCNPLQFSLTALPGYFTVGQGNASVTISLPVNASEMKIEIFAGEGPESEEIYRTPDAIIEPAVIPIPARNLTAGTNITIQLHAIAAGFEPCDERITIPVIAQAESEGAVLRLVNNLDDKAPIDLSQIMVNQDMVYLVTPTEGNEITAVRFFNGHDWWENGEAITRQNHDDWFLDDGSVHFWERYNVEENRTVTAFAEVLVNGSDTWERTNAISFTVHNNGSVGRFDFENADPIRVPRGTVFTVTFTVPEGGEGEDYMYGVEAWDAQGRGVKIRTNPDGRSVRVAMYDAEPGTYELRGIAGAPGKLQRESERSMRVTITNETPEIGTITFTPPAMLMGIEREAFAGIAAQVVEITGSVAYIDDEAFAGAQVRKVVFRSGNTMVSWNAFAGNDDLIVYGPLNSEVYEWAKRNLYTFYATEIQ